jgi:5'-nucleotidase
VVCVYGFVPHTGHAQTVLTIQAARNTANQQISVRGVITRAQGQFGYLQDPTAAIAVVQTAGNWVDAIASQNVKTGDSVFVRGIVKDSFQLKILRVDSFSVLAANRSVPVQELTLAQLAANPEAFECELIRVKNLTITPLVPANPVFAANSNYEITDPSGSFATIAFHVPQKTVSQNNTQLVGVTIPAPPNVVFEGVLSQRNALYRLTGIYTTDLYRSNPLRLLHVGPILSSIQNAGPSLEDFGNLARVKTVLGSKKAEAAGQNIPVVTLFSGGLFAETSQRRAAEILGQPVEGAALEQLGMDAAGIAQADLLYGPSGLAPHISATNTAKFVASNLLPSPDPALAGLVIGNRLVRQQLVTVGNQMLGIVSVVHPALADSVTPRQIGIESNLVLAAQNAVNTLTAAGAKLIVVITGLRTQTDELTLIAQLQDVDVVVSGQSETLLATGSPLLVPDGLTVAGSYPLSVPDVLGKTVRYVAVPGRGKYVGSLDIELDEDGVVRAVGSGSNPIRVAGNAQPDAVVPAPDLAGQLAAHATALNDLSTQAIATTQVRLEGLTTDLQTRETNFGNLVADAMRQAGQNVAQAFGLSQPTIAFFPAADLKFNANINIGQTITEQQAFAGFFGREFLSIVPNLTISQLKILLEHAVSTWNDVQGSNRLLQIAGFRVVYDPRQQAQVLSPDGTVQVTGNRVVQVALSDGTPLIVNGQPVASPPVLNAVTTQALAKRFALGFPLQTSAAVNIGISQRQAFVSFLQNTLSGNISPLFYPVAGVGRIAFVRPLPSDTLVCDSLVLQAGFGANSYTWNQQTGTRNFTVSSSDTVELAVSYINNYIYRDTIVVTINKSPVAGFTATTSANSVNFTNQTTSLQTSYVWDFGDGTTSTQANPSHIYPNQNATYTVTLTATNPCGSNSVTQAVSIAFSPNPIAVFSPDTTNLCAPATITFTNLSTGADVYDWDMGDGTVIPQAPQANLEYQYLNGGVFIVRLVARNSVSGLTDTVTQTVNIYPAPDVSVTASGPLVFCLGDSIELSGAVQPFATYTWLRDGQVIVGADQPTLKVLESGDYRLRVVSAVGCVDTSIIQQVRVGPLAVPTVVAQSDTFLCPANPGVVLVGQGIPAGVGVEWLRNGVVMVGETTTQLSVSDSGSYQVRVFTSSSCSNQSRVIRVELGKSLSVTNLRIASGNDTLFCAGDSVRLIASGSSATGRYTLLRNGTTVATASRPEFTVVQSGDYSMVLTELGGCPDTTNTLRVSIGLSDLEITVRNDTLFVNAGDNPVQWYVNGLPVPGATRPYLVVQQGGLYSVELSIPGGCTGRAVLDLPTGRGVFQNPTFKLECKTEYQAITLLANRRCSVRLLDLKGILVHSLFLEAGLPSRLEHSGLADGLYFVIAEDGTQRFSQKLLLNR